MGFIEAVTEDAEVTGAGSEGPAAVKALRTCSVSRKVTQSAGALRGRVMNDWISISLTESAECRPGVCWARYDSDSYHSTCFTDW